MSELTLWQKIKWKLRAALKKSFKENLYDLLGLWPKIKLRLRERRQRELRKAITSLNLFDGNWYLLNNPDVQRSGADPLTHYMRHGFAEGRKPGPNAAIRIEPYEAPSSENSQRDEESPAPTRLLAAAKSLSPEAVEQIKRAALHEPAIGDARHVAHILCPPDHDPVAKAQVDMRSAIPGNHFDTVICVPWLRQGGADLVASLMASALARIFPDQSILIVRTDFSHFDRPDWLPAGVAVVDLSPIFTSVGREAAERLLYSLVIGLEPLRVININSRLCWTTFERFGRRLAEQMSVFAYLFCWEFDANGGKHGYPREFYPTTGPHLTGIFTDTEFLREDLTRTYSLPAMERDRILPLFSPARGEIATPTMAERQTASSTPRNRPLILWAGRLDRQKRFDLVLAIAAKMADVDFQCWGSALLDAPPNLANLPRNLTLKDSFKSLDDLPLDRCDAWLFTSGWEGLPTLLIELGAKGVPIVASAVGGVPELITAETGWPISEIENIDAYITALRQAIAEPQTRCDRASLLQALVKEKHSLAAYERRIADILSTDWQYAEDRQVVMKQGRR